MIHKVYYSTRKDGVNLFRIYSDKTPIIRQIPTNVDYDCWTYNEDGNVDFSKSGVIDVEHAPYSYIEIEGEATNEIYTEE